MNKPKVLIHVVGGVAYWTASGEVDVVLVDEDNIRAGDTLLRLTPDWSELAVEALGGDVHKLCALEELHAAKVNQV